MKMLPKQKTQAFTLVEMLMVIGIIGIVVGLTVALLGGATTKKQEAATRAQIAKIQSALESYKKKFGTYPPDNPAWAALNPQWNPLAYELGGVRNIGPGAAPNFAAECDPNHVVSPAMLGSYFSLPGFVNQKTGASAETFLNLKGGTGPNADYGLLTNGTGQPAAMLLLVPADHPMGGSANVWRYRAYPATGHNPKSFDLWAEIKQKGGGTNFIKNWK